MKKKIIIIIVVIFSFVLLSFGLFKFYQKWRIDHAIIKVELQDNLNIEIYSKIKLKDLIKSINGKLLENPQINTTKLGEKTLSFKYINEENIKVPYSFNIKIVDTTKPIISMYNSYSVTVGYDGNIAEELFCGDNYDDNPTCLIEGEYDLNTPGEYPVTYKATDSSHNEITHNFVLRVKEKTPSSNNNTYEEPVTTAFSDVYNTHKTAKTKIGIDVSHWQGDIDFKKVKESGVEFAFIRVGSQKGIGGEYYVDNKFIQNIEGFNKVGIPVGIYFYSYAKNKKDAIKEAKWILKQIKKYDVSLPIAFDWENWSFYQEFNLSFYHLTEMANAFMDTIKKAGYEGMLYSSKNYLENIWYETSYPIWLAHYTKQTNYEGDYRVWQLCSNGVVDGIADNMVDINIMY